MRFSAALVVFLMFSCRISGQTGNQWITTTRLEPWKIKPLPALYSRSGNADAEVLPDHKMQLMEGFGACFNELGWESLNSLKSKDRDGIFKELFMPEFGACFTLCRMPMGANDFSRNWYSYDETDGDFDLKDFNIGNDQQTLIPFIKQAEKYNPDLKIWASPWSPPSWMKYNKHYACAVTPADLDSKFRNGLLPENQGKEGTDMFIQEDDYFKAYSHYFSRFIESYRQQGIVISSIMPQNEFNSCQIFPSCTWTPLGLARFIGRYLGPEMEKQHVDIMFGTMERPDEELVNIVLRDTFAGKYIRGAGFQWGGKDAIAGIRKNHPELKLYQTEQECGDGKNGWNYCLYCWNLMKHYINNGASAYMYWNISLNKDGFSRWGWQQNSLISVDTLNRTFSYNYEYYLMKHLSHFVKPGAMLIQTRGAYDNLLAFINPDKSLVLIMQNDSGGNKIIKIQIGNEQLAATLDPDSFNTILLKNK